MTIADVLSGAAQWHVETGDCREVLATLPDRSVAHVITDPPYDVETHEGARRLASPGVVADQGIDFAPLDVAASVPMMLRVAERWVVSFCSLQQLGAYRDAAGEAWVRAGVWAKPGAAPQFTGDRPAQGADGIAILHRAGRKRWNGGGSPALWTYPPARGPDRGHPTPKPIDLMLALVASFTDPGDVVLDPFCGSGTTGVACVRLGRRFVGVEVDPTWAALSRERLAAESQGLTLTAARRGQESLFGAQP